MTNWRNLELFKNQDTGLFRISSQYQEELELYWSGPIDKNPYGTGFFSEDEDWIWEDKEEVAKEWIDRLNKLSFISDIWDIFSSRFKNLGEKFIGCKGGWQYDDIGWRLKTYDGLVMRVINEHEILLTRSKAELSIRIII